jgi:iron uptake system component EfeO
MPRTFNQSRLRLAGLVVLCLSACTQESTSVVKTNQQYQTDIANGMHDSLLADIEALQVAASSIQKAAPSPQGRGWDPVQDADALTAMRTAWKKARSAYEHMEGAIAPLFPDIDFSIDARYDDFLARRAGKGDDNPFDDKDVTGLHAVERILWADSIPQRVIDFEAALPGYKPAAFPATEQEADDFKQLLCAKVATDSDVLHKQWKPQSIDLAGTFQGLISLMNEQQEKVNKAASNEEESRYSQRTMADIRDNLAGTLPIYELFAPWLRTKSDPTDPNKDGPQTDEKIRAGFDQLSRAYARVQGDAIPEPPPTWSAEAPTPDDLHTEFGTLYSAVKQAVNPARGGSIVSEMNTAADVLGFAAFRQK